MAVPTLTGPLVTNADGSTFEVGSPASEMPWSGGADSPQDTPRLGVQRHDSWNSSRDSLLGASPSPQQGVLAHSTSEVWRMRVLQQ